MVLEEVCLMDRMEILNRIGKGPELLDGVTGKEEILLPDKHFQFFLFNVRSVTCMYSHIHFAVCLAKEYELVKDKMTFSSIKGNREIKEVIK